MAARQSPESLDHHQPSVSWHALEREALDAKLDTGPTGLAPLVASDRLERYGHNEFEAEPPTPALEILLRQFRSPLIYILLVAAAVTLILQEYIDVIVIVAVVVLNTVLGFTQERQAEKFVRSLASMASPRARVVQDGREDVLESRDLVPGDVVLLESGDRVPADLRLVSATALQIDEAPLTGESVPAVKRTDLLPEATALADRRNMAYAATTVASGRGRGYVVGTGTATELGAIATQMRAVEREKTPLEQRMARFAVLAGVAVAVASILAFVIGLAQGDPVSEIFMVAVALAVSSIPEGLPIATTIALAIGVRRMAQRNAIVRHLPTVETLGSTTVIGSDKTGTLTENRMTVRRIWSAGQAVTIDDVTASEVNESEALRMTLLVGSLANEAQAIRFNGEWQTTGDPTEAALLVAANGAGIDVDGVRNGHAVLAEKPFEPELQYSMSVREIDGVATACVKGAPERILAMSRYQHGPAGIEPLDRDAVVAAADALAAQGLRVLAMAYADVPAADAADDHFQPGDLVLAGLTGMLDPPRGGVRDAIGQCRTAGIRTVMITGDHASTAGAIGRSIGLGNTAEVVTGVDLDRLDPASLERVVNATDVFARVAPEHKHQVVQALQANGEVVAVTGDGVNDAPALRAADVGIAMGRSGTDVARESADIVLTDDNFVSIVSAVEIGRVIFDNVRKVTYFLVSTSVAEIIAILVAISLGWPLPFLAVQILWLNLATNGIQDLALAFEPGEPDTLKRRPTPRDAGLMSGLLWERSLIVGLVMAVGTLALFRWELDRGGDLMQAQTVALTTMVVFQVFQAGNSRSETRSLFQMSPFSNRFLFLATAGALLVHIGALYWGPSQYVLRVSPIDLDSWVRIVLVASTVLVASEIHKWIRRSYPGR